MIENWDMYCAGLYEGEGTITCTIQETPHGSQRRISLKISMTDKEPLELFQETMYVGKIFGPYMHDSRKKPIYDYSISAYTEVKQVTERIINYLSPRRQLQIDLALTAYECWKGRNAKKHKRLSDAEIIEIRVLYKPGKGPELAAMFNVSVATICKVAGYRGRFRG